MPFQGNSNAGAPDPGLINMLFQERARRQELQRQAQLDAAAAQIQARKDQRDDMMFRVDMAKKVLDFQKAQAEGKDAGIQQAAELAPKLDLALDERSSPSERHAGASAYIAGLQERAQNVAGFDPMGNPNPVTGNILNRLGNEAAASSGLARREADATPSLDWEYDSAGNKRRVTVGPGGRMTPVPGAVWVTPKSGVTVNVGGEGGLDLNQIATASRAEQQVFQTKIAPYEAIDNAISSIESFVGMADENGMLPFEASQFISSDVMASLRGEALNEGDVRRLSSAGYWNAAKNWAGVPTQMSAKQAEILLGIVRDRAKRREGKKKSIIREGIRRARSFGFDPYLIVGDYAEQYSADGTPIKVDSSGPRVIENLPSIPGGSDPRFPRIETNGK